MTIAMPLHIDARTNRRINVLSAGISAVGFLADSEQWRIIATFRRCFYCEDAAGNIVCVAAPSVDRGPFILNCNQEEYTNLPGCKVGNCIRVDNDHLYLEDDSIVFDLEKASVWHCPLDIEPAFTPRLQHDLEKLGAIARIKAPPESLGTLIPQILHTNRSEFLQPPDIFTAAIHNQVLDAIQSTLESYKYNDAVDAVLARCTKLIGLGRGLTPSGDDFIAGIILAFYNQGQFVEAKNLARIFHSQAINKTSSISMAFYRSLACGTVVESYTRFVHTFGKGISENSSMLSRITNFGATSGWDFLAGFAFGLSLLFPAATRMDVC